MLTKYKITVIYMYEREDGKTIREGMEPDRIRIEQVAKEYNN